MKITILDAKTIEKGDLSWDVITNIAPCDIYPSTKPSEIYNRCKNTDIIIANKISFDDNILKILPQLKLISVTATGVNQIDLKAAKLLNIKIANVPNYSTYSVAQMVFAHILNLTQQVFAHNQLVKDGEWQRNGNFCFWNNILLELKDLNLGIVGFGNIGKIVAQIGYSFGMNIKIYTRHPKQQTYPQYEFISLDNLFKTSDIVTLHCPLTNNTNKFVNKDLLGMMKKSAFLINSSRGGLIDELALANALNSDMIKGAGLDVLSTEPPKDDNPLLSSKNTIITPHIAWATIEARQRVLNETAQNIKSFLKGINRNLITELMD